jgi:hypothetical protein
MRRSAWLLVVIACLCLPVAATGKAKAPSWLTLARAQLPTLQVKPAGAMTGYDRVKRFGQPWQDVDHNGCDTRDDILKRDLTKLEFEGADSCHVQSGRLHDPYTGKFINFVRGIKTSLAVQIDHVVALADAWRTGAKKWNKHRRVAYANDPDVLLAVDGPSNNAKGDDDASEWLPPRKAYDCRYVARQIAVKKKYTLWVTPAERDAMADQLASC